ncbi:MAG: TolC family protein [Phycisphaerales bacterium]|nr:TolC family protein [Phycisphaerales bacterium]
MLLITGIVVVGGCRTAEEHKRGLSIPTEFLAAGGGGELQASATERSEQSQEASKDSGAASSEPAWPADGTLTLEQAEGVALRSNPDIDAALARFEAAQARVGQAQSAFWPLIAFGHKSARTFHTPASRNRLALGLQTAPVLAQQTSSESLIDLSTILNALRRPLFGGNDATGDRNSFSEHSASMSVSWTVYDGFVRDARERAAKHVEDAARSSREDARRLILQAVRTAYHQAQLGEEQLRIARADETFSREQLDVTRKLFEAHKVGGADVGNFELRATAALANVTAAEAVRDTGLVLLAELMGVSGAAFPERVQLSPLSPESVEELAAPDGDAWIARAAEHRPDLRQFHSLVRSEEENIAAARGLYQPIVSVSGSWGFDRTSNLEFSNDDQSTAAAFELRWDLFTGGLRRQTVLEAAARKREAEALLRSRRLAVEADVRRAIIDVEQAQREIALQEQSVRISMENRRIVQEAYQAGKETLTRLNEAQRDYIAADAELALARIRLRQAWTSLHAAAGVEP